MSLVTPPGPRVVSFLGAKRGKGASVPAPSLPVSFGRGLRSQVTITAQREEVRLRVAFLLVMRSV